VEEVFPNLSEGHLAKVLTYQANPRMPGQQSVSLRR
jgi:hypothetical protein